MSRLAQIIDNGSTVSGKRWTVRYREPGGRTGRQREKSFSRKKDAVDFATKMEGDKRENIYVAPDAGKVSLRRYADDWLAKKTASAGTLESYERIVRLHVAPHLGSKMISQVTAADIEGLYACWRQDGAALNTIESRHIALSTLFSHAVRHRRIPVNPMTQAEKLENPAIPVDDRKLPGFEEITAIAKEIGPRLSPAIWRKEGEWRDIPVPASLEPFIDRLPIRNASGGMPYPDLLRKSWDRAIKRIELPAYNPHDLRHKWTTVALTDGVSIHEVSRWLGHRSIKVTVDRYGHLTQDGQERCRQVVETTVGPHTLTADRATAARGADSTPS